MERPTLRLYESLTLMNLDSVSGEYESFLDILSGSKLVVTLQVTSIDPDANVSVSIRSAFSADGTYDELNTISRSAVGSTTVVVTDFHALFKIIVTVTAGKYASYLIGVSSKDSSAPVVINADVIQLPDGLATSDKQDAGNASLSAISNKLPVIWDQMIQTVDPDTQELVSVVYKNEGVVVLTKTFTSDPETGETTVNKT